MPARTPDCAVFDVDLEAYSMEAVYGASYIFLDRFYLSMEKPGKKILRVTMRPKTGTSDPGALAGEFKNELLNQVLRETVAAKNAKLREYIIGRALYGAENAEGAPSGGDYQDDPLGIAVPWEQKYGKKK